MLKVCVNDEKVWRLQTEGPDRHVLLGGHTLWGRVEDPFVVEALKEADPGAQRATGPDSFRVRLAELMTHVKCFLLGRRYAGGRG